MSPDDEQLAHRRTDVAQAQPHVVGQLVLEREVVLVDVGALEVGVDSLITECGEVGCRRAAGEAVPEAAAGGRVCEAELVGREQVADALDRDGRVEQPEAATEHRLAALVESPGEAHSWAEVVLVGVD